jgi:hypothetical protein
MIVSSLVTVFLLGLSILFIIEVPYGWLWALFIMAIPLIAYLWSPKKYIFTNGTLEIKKVIGRQIVIRINDIEAYGRIDNFAKLKAVRTFGNGGLFGFYGFFSTAEYGRINCQLTRMKDIIIIKTRTMNYALSPKECGDLERYLKDRIQSITGHITPLQAQILDRKTMANPIILILPSLLFLAMLVMTLLNYRQMPDRIAVHFNAFGQPDRWGSKISYLISGLVPSGILFLLTVGIFFIVRRATKRKAIPNFLVIIMSFILLFTGFISFASFYFNKYGRQLLPMQFSFIIFGIILVVLLIYYYRSIKQSTN